MAGQRLAAAVIAVGQRTCHPSARPSFLFYLLRQSTEHTRVFLCSESLTTGLHLPIAPAELIKPLLIRA